MPRPKVLRRIAVSVVAVIVAVAVVLGVLVVGQLRRSLPQTSGELHVAGLGGDVTVIRGAHGIPQIYADNPEDLFRAQGFVAAQDRFFQMDLRRHIVSGRLSELVGKDGLDTDRVIRTMGWYHVAQEELPKLSPKTQSYLRAYADGVNAYISSKGSPSDMSLEYAVLARKFPGYHVRRWTPVDSLAWLKAMAWDLRGDYADELARARLAGTMSMRHIDALYPPYPYRVHAPILSARDWSPPPGAGQLPPAAHGRGATVNAAYRSLRTPDARRAFSAVNAALRKIPATLGRGEGIGSNSWVVSGAHTTTGKPLLANDPHLGVGIPGIWYQTGLHCRTVSAQCPFDVSGFTFAGLPGVVIGHNAHIAWGFTNLGPDVSDFYLEKVVSGSYERDGSYRPITVRHETIHVAGGKDVPLTVRSTVHGPIMSDVLPDVAAAGGTAPVAGKEQHPRYAVSLAWTGLRPTRTADAIFELNAATDWQQFRRAAKDFAVPAQNLVYADTQGHIGYQAPGMVPIRRSAIKHAPPGYWPAPGWDSRYDWKGFVDFADLPHVLDPAEGFIVTANQAVTASTKPFLTTEWGYGFRSERIRTLLERDQKISPAQMGRIQLDTRNIFAPSLVPMLLSVDLHRSPFIEEAQRLLRHWNYTSPADGSSNSAAAAYYNAVWSHLLTLTFDDELPRDLQADGGGRWREAVAQLLARPNDPWWDNKSTPAVTEGRDEILRQAMVDARLDLTKTLGKKTDTWQWGRLHQLTLKSDVLGGDGVPGVIRSIFNRGPYPMPGDTAVVDANGWNADQGYQVDWAPSMRMVVDLGHLDRSRWVNETGNSGHPYSGNYDDQIESWIKGESHPWPFSHRAVHAAADDTLILKPSGSKP
ncbi:MAG TPA: penicillin acylase family protein [Segeticoccus sp.]|uniref:penicillin acylase family protein n=1 Tax=Segeticoccus sp. TaxID=2706531 RepID=UPI002D7FCEDE|nr:penicillin acylase family protein [Segeticoccus sp.]HET8600059.1 penicillin acylase family protein [Segeticoccus sp.]